MKFRLFLENCILNVVGVIVFEQLLVILKFVFVLDVKFFWLVVSDVDVVVYMCGVDLDILKFLYGMNDKKKLQFNVY